MIPDFDQHGYLPPGVYPATIEEIASRFGWQSELRRVQMESIRWLLDASKRAGILRIVIDGSFATDRLEPNDVDCAVMTGLDIDEHKSEVEAIEEIPFLHVLALDAENFDPVVDDLFGTDRRGIVKGFIEVTSWN